MATAQQYNDAGAIVVDTDTMTKARAYRKALYHYWQLSKCHTKSCTHVEKGRMTCDVPWEKVELAWVTLRAREKELFGDTLEAP